MRGWVRERCAERLERLSSAEGDPDALRLEAIELLRRAIGFTMWGLPLVDPETLIPYRPLVSDPPPWGSRLPERWILDQSTTEINDRSALARGRHHVAVLSMSTGGDLARCRRWREFGQPIGMGDELRAAIVDAHGCWGSFELFRASDDPPFDRDDADLVGYAAGILAPALRRGSVTVDERGQEPPPETGVVVLGGDLQPRGATASAAAWLNLLTAPTRGEPTRFPIVVYGTVGRLLARESGDDAARVPRVRVRAGTGQWLTIEAVRLGEREIAVSLGAARPSEVLGLLSRASGLTARERQLVELVASGLDTRQIAGRLSISSYTAKDHVKAVFDKMGIHSRRELLTGLIGPTAVADVRVEG